MTNIDTILPNGLTMESRIMKYDVNATLAWATQLSDQDIESSPILATDATLTYDQIIDNLGPASYYSFEEANSGVAAVDDAPATTHAFDGAYTGGCVLQQAGAIVGDPQYGVKIPQGDQMFVNAGLNLGGANGTWYSTWSIEFYIKPTAVWTGGEQVILGIIDHTTTFPGGISTENYTLNKTAPSVTAYCDNTMTNVYQLRINSLGGVFNPAKISNLAINAWTHVVITGFQGITTVYINGRIRASWGDPSGSSARQSCKGAGHIFKVGCVFTGSYPTAGGTPTYVMPATYYDELALYNNLLSATEINRHYLKSQNGYTVVGGTYTGGTGQANPPGDPRQLPTLINGQDVTKYISDWIINKDDRNLIDTLQLSCAEVWTANTLNTVFRANSYVTIESRFLTLDGSIDSDWQMRGHFLINGPAAKDIDSSGKRFYRVEGQGLLKWASFDHPNNIIAPDILHIPKQDATNTSSNPSEFDFQIPRIGYTGLYYTNWATFPRPQAWGANYPGPYNASATNISPYSAGDIVKPTDVVRARGNENSVQFVYGEGIMRFQGDYFTSRVVANGFGNPATVSLEGYRTAIALDVIQNVPITAIIKTLDGGGNIIFSGFKVAYDATKFFAGEAYVGRKVFVKSGNALGNWYEICSWTDTGTDYKAGVKLPNKSLPDLASDGLAIADTVQIGDANLLEDALMKAFKLSGFQNQDATKPFYFTVEAPAVSGGVLVPPLEYFFENGPRIFVDVIRDILSYGPTNYVVFVDNSGITRGKNFYQNAIGAQDATLLKVLDMVQDRSDFGIYTSVVGQGSTVSPTNVGLVTSAGGTATVGAYNLDNFIDGGSDTGVTKSQAAADAIIAQIPDGNSQTPALTLHSWQANYGVVKRMYGDANCQFFTMGNQDLFWMDIGRNSVTTKEYLIEQLCVSLLPPWPNGLITPQTIQVFYMTEEDFITSAGFIPAATTGAAGIATAMLSMINDDAWKPLTDEVELQDGLNIIDSKKFKYGRETKLRFLKWRIIQPYFRMHQDGLTDPQNSSSIIMANVQVWTSTKIIQVAQLGVTPPFDTNDAGDLMKRLRRRRILLDLNPYLDTPQKVQDFSLVNLQEMVTLFSPWQIRCISPLIDLYQTVQATIPDDNTTNTYVVQGVRHTSDGVTEITGTDYLTILQTI